LYIYIQVLVRDITLECLQITPTKFRGSKFPPLWWGDIVFVLSVTQFVSATPLKLMNRISWNLVGSKDTICSCAYYQEIFIASMKHKQNLIESAKARVTGTIPYCHGKVPNSRKLLSLSRNDQRIIITYTKIVITYYQH
jgi:hypothetical protein